MHFEAIAAEPLSVSTDAIIVPLGAGKDGPTWPDVALQADAALSGHLRPLADESRFKARLGASFALPTLGKLPAKRVILVGNGSSESSAANALLTAGGAAARAARDLGARSVLVTLPESDEQDPDFQIEALATGIGLGLYQFTKYRGAAAGETAVSPELESVTFAVPGLSEAQVKSAIRRGEAVIRAVNLARDLTNEPASTLTPAVMAERATEMASASGLEIEVLGPSDLEALGAAAILTVGGGSSNPPRLIRLRYRPEGANNGGRTVGLVGKAITFDTGGYSIKPYEGMLEMKGDMAGGAAVLGAMSALRALRCPVAVEATICAAENMISGTSFRPGDIIRGMNGVTMEILSTDAEGRLVLADGLVDTARRGATELIDLATLTGAAVVALGEGTMAIFASDDRLAEQLQTAAKSAGERMWRLPLTEELERKIEGDVGDIKNSGGRAGGAITAALFLQHFSEDLPWAHLDIAGSSRQDRATALGPKGATGVGVRTLLRYLLESGASD
jgi:leucyl aminopeptidase